MQVRVDVDVNYLLTQSWSGAKERIQEIAEAEKLDEFLEYLEEYFYEEAPTDVELNDFIWFECDDWIEENCTSAADKLAEEIKLYKWAGDKYDDDDNEIPENTICGWEDGDDEIIDCLETFISGYIDNDVENINLSKSDDTITAHIIFDDYSEMDIKLKHINGYCCLDFGKEVDDVKEN